MHGGLLQCLPSRGQCWHLGWLYVSDNTFAPAYCPHVKSHNLNVIFLTLSITPLDSIRGWHERLLCGTHLVYISSPNWRCPLLRVTGVTLRIAGPNVGCLRVPLKHKTLLGLYFALTTRFSSFYRKQLPRQRQVTGVPLSINFGSLVFELTIAGSFNWSLKFAQLTRFCYTNVLLLQEYPT